MNRFKYNIVVTGGAGFIGSNLLNYLVPKYREYRFVNIDCLTYAGNLANLENISTCSNYVFEKISIVDYGHLKSVFEKYQIDGLIHLAAESHVDRSIYSPQQFINTNIVGTFNLLEMAKETHQSGRDFRFYHISTDEVYGSIKNGQCDEQARYNPSSPYAAAKASSDHLVMAYHKTYGLDIVISNCTNNYGPYQFPEKLLPMVIMKALKMEEIPVYGDGAQERDWLYVLDHCLALDTVYHKGKAGEVYNISGNNTIYNLELIKKVCGYIDAKIGNKDRVKLIRFVADRPGHDRRYALDSSKIKRDLDWKPTIAFDQGLVQTIDWYLNNQAWLQNCLNGEYLKYYEKVYLSR